MGNGAPGNQAGKQLPVAFPAQSPFKSVPELRADTSLRGASGLQSPAESFWLKQRRFLPR